MTIHSMHHSRRNILYCSNARQGSEKWQKSDSARTDVMKSFQAALYDTVGNTDALIIDTGRRGISFMEVPVLSNPLTVGLILLIVIKKIIYGLAIRPPFPLLPMAPSYAHIIWSALLALGIFHAR